MKIKRKFINKSIKLFAGTSIITGIVFFGLAIWKFSQFYSISTDAKPLDMDATSQIGSFIGGILGPIWALTGILLFYLALNYQRKEFKLQRKELEMTRNEMSQSREEMKLQNDTIKFQRFENTFFNMLTLHHDIVNHIDVEDGRIIQGKENIPRKKYTARDAFEHTYISLKAKISNWSRHHDGNEIDRDSLNNLFIEHYKNYKTDFGHYFRNLYRIIKTIDETIFDDDPVSNFKEQYRYTSIIRAQLSDFELLWIYYNCLSKNGVNSFKRLVEKYTLLKNMPFDEISNPNSKKWYILTARKKPVNIEIHLELINNSDIWTFYNSNKQQLFQVKDVSELDY